MRYIKYSLLVLGLTILGAGGVAPAQEEEAQKDSAQELQELRKELQDLRQQERRLRRRIRELSRHLDLGEAEERTLQPLTPPRMRMPDLDLHLRNLQEHFEGLRRHLRDLRGLEGIRGHALSVHRGPEGQVRVEVRRITPEGEEQVDVYKAESPEAFAQRYPEVMERYGLSFGDKGRLDIQVMPRIERRLRGPQEGLTPWPWQSPPEGGRLGVFVEPVTAEHAEKLGLEDRTGLRVLQVEPRSLARNLGIRKGDVLLEVNGVAITGVESVRKGLRRKPGGTATVKVWRGDKEGTVTLQAERGRTL